MKKTSRRILAILLALVMMLALASCGGKKDKESPSPSPSPSETPTATPTPEPVYVDEYIGTVHDVSSYLRVRSGPGTEYEVLGEAHAGDKFTVLETNVDGGAWHKISYSGGEGFVHGDYLTIDVVQVQYHDSFTIMTSSEPSEEPSAEPTPEG